VGPGVVLTFYGHWSNPVLDEPLYANVMQQPLTHTLQSSLEPGASILVTVAYAAANNAPGVLPDDVRVVVDEANQERECDEANNELTSAVDPGTLLPDLRVVLGAVNEGLCPDPTVETTVFNDGSAPASNIVVRYYAGDPSQGGSVLAEHVVAGPIDPGQSQSYFMILPDFPSNLVILVYAVIDPDDAIVECNDGNNKDPADAKILCSKVN
jgi:hypothetical protein